MAECGGDLVKGKEKHHWVLAFCLKYYCLELCNKIHSV